MNMRVIMKILNSLLLPQLVLLLLLLVLIGFDLVYMRRLLSCFAQCSAEQSM